MKKRISILLAMAMLLSVGCVACAASDTGSSTVQPQAVVYDQYITGSAQFVSTSFSCIQGQGNSLRYWFKNTGNETCTVDLYKKNLFGSSFVSSMRVSASGNKSVVYKNPGFGTFYLMVTSDLGGAIRGTLRANQLNLAAS